MGCGHGIEYEMKEVMKIGSEEAEGIYRQTTTVLSIRNW